MINYSRLGYENLCCLESLSKNFTPKCVRALDRGFGANDYYRYFLKRGERFIIRAKKNRNVITPAVKCRRFYLLKFPSAALSSIVAALATTHSSALQMKIYSS